MRFKALLTLPVIIAGCATTNHCPPTLSQELSQLTQEHGALTEQALEYQRKADEHAYFAQVLVGHEEHRAAQNINELSAGLYIIGVERVTAQAREREDRIFMLQETYPACR